MIEKKLHINIGEIDIQDMQRSFIDHVDPRRRQEYQESQMVNEDHMAVANLPQRGYQVEYDFDYKPRYLRQ